MSCHTGLLLGRAGGDAVDIPGRPVYIAVWYAPVAIGMSPACVRIMPGGGEASIGWDNI